MLITKKLCHNWMQQFVDIHTMVIFPQKCQLTCSMKNELQIEIHTTYELRVLQKTFEYSLFDENVVVMRIILLCKNVYYHLF